MKLMAKAMFEIKARHKAKNLSLGCFGLKATLEITSSVWKQTFV